MVFSLIYWEITSRILSAKLIRFFVFANSCKWYSEIFDISVFSYNINEKLLIDIFSSFFFNLLGFTIKNLISIKLLLSSNLWMHIPVLFIEGSNPI